MSDLSDPQMGELRTECCRVLGAHCIGCPKKAPIFNPLASPLSRAYYRAYFGAECEARVRQTDIALVDLMLPEAEIRAAFRKSAKPQVNWGMRRMDIRVMDQTNADKQQFDAFREFHKRVSGRTTRSYETWDIQYRMIVCGEAYAVMARFEDDLVAANLILTAGGAPYYGVGVYDRALMTAGVPCAHAPLWCAILYAKECEFKTFILGDVGKTGDEKLDNISAFKRGFATSIERGEWAEVVATAPA